MNRIELAQDGVQYCAFSLNPIRLHVSQLRKFPLRATNIKELIASTSVSGDSSFYF